MTGAVDKLQKLTISAFANSERSKLQGSFQALLNPQTLKQTSSVNYSQQQGINTSGRSQVYNFSPPQHLSFKLIIDGTGPMFVKLAEKGGTVASEIERFRTLAQSYNGATHQPNFLLVSWGELNFNCRLQSLTINYTLFDDQGRPLNAELDCVFISDEPESTLVKKENKQSPDMTHIRYIDAANSLTIIANDIYQSPTYYLTLAQFNGINNFRNLPYGQEIICPPLAKLTALQEVPNE